MTIFNTQEKQTNHSPHQRKVLTCRGWNHIMCHSRSKERPGVQKSSCLPPPKCLLLPQPPDGPESPGKSLASENLVTNSLDLQQSRSLYIPPHQFLLDLCDSLSNVFLPITELSLIMPLPFFTHTNDILGYSHSSTLYLFIHSLV